MGNSQGRDNVRKRKARRKETERLALAKRKSRTRASGSRAGRRRKQLGVVGANVATRVIKAAK